jgi:intraflagellar transport protein 140
VFVYECEVPMQGASTLIQSDSIIIESPAEALLGIHIPFVYLVTRSDAARPGATRIMPKCLRDFVGLDISADGTKKALIDFSYFMAMGNMDEAYKAVKVVASPHVWENMAQMCVKTKKMEGKSQNYALALDHCW